MLNYSYAHFECNPSIHSAVALIVKRPTLQVDIVLYLCIWTVAGQ